MKRPTESDCTVKLLDAGVEVTFKPSDSKYTFRLLADPEDIAREGPLSKPPMVRHGTSGDTGDYLSNEVLAMATRLAEDAVKRRR